MTPPAAKAGRELTLRIVEGADAARAEVLRRDPLSEPVLPDALSQSIAELWGAPLSAREHVARIIADVAREGDAAVARYSQRFDGSTYTTVEVSPDEFTEAFELVSPEQREALEFAAERVRRYHRTQLRHGPQSFSERGTGMIVRPIERAGIYMTGSDAALPSSVIHTAVPGAVAGVEHLIGVTAARPDGSVNPLKLVAARFAGIRRVFRASGAQAIAALAFGTETIPRVDKIFGPGGIFVTLAKQQLYGRVGIDAIYGPTETLVLADDSAAPDLCAADLLAQAEHDVLATPILITTSRAHAEAVAVEVELQLETLERAEIARAAIARGGAVVAADIDEAIALANEFAPEHLCLLTRQPETLVHRVRNAGGIFVGESSPEVLGDYTAGPSHVMPTGGSARFASPLSVLDFLKITSTVNLSEGDLQRLGPFAATIARAEGLTGHARSIERRLEGR
ncbi:MAG: histidinol dehydrogenase [Chloroflexi bacterium]|nr:histidinol dehydrogenase [Chloroflexota bacterium]MDA1002212.1 histidinol dehydrogenase [Chloroflexota bacterium]MQC27969.1 histidinol dehydrogenase [Chloroflexota bacterium]